MTWPPDSVTHLAKTIGRPPQRLFGIKQPDRFSHIYIIGKTGTGKSTLLENMIMQDIHAGRGVCLIDPHGDLVERIANDIPKHRKSDLIYLNVPKVPEVSKVTGYNPLRQVRADKRSLAASGVWEVFKKMWGHSWGVRMEHILRNAILTLMEVPGSNLSDILRLLSDSVYRKRIVKDLTNTQIKYFWEQEFDKYSDSFRKTAIAPIQNKVSAFLTDPIIRRVVVNPDKEISFRRIMDNKQILLVNLARGQIGDDATGLLGGLLVTTLGLAAFSRQDLPEHERQDFHMYMDEFQNFTTLSTANMTSELRKFRVGMVLANQYLTQLEPDIRDAVIGNCGTLISFRLGARDSTLIAKELAPVFKQEDIMHLPNYQIYLKLMIDGAPSRPFSAKTIPLNFL